MTLLNLILAFIAGMIFMWYFGYRLMGRVYGKGKMLDHVLRNLGPDAFVRLRKAVEAERQRRDSL